jgi:hydrogenase nickel incorporation protein HypB
MPTKKHTHQGKQRLLRIEQDLLNKNSLQAEQNRQFFEQKKILALNLVSSSGSGKTALLVATIQILKNLLSIVVVEGEQKTGHDAEKIAAAGAHFIHLPTDNAFSVDANLVSHTLTNQHLPERSLLVIESNANQPFPGLFDLGARYKVVMLAVTEGEDKPLRYPEMFKNADLVIINKIDLLPYVDFDIKQCMEYAQRINPEIQILSISVTQETNLNNWIRWVNDHLID